MKAISSILATYSMAGRVIQPPICSWARQRIGMTADACLPGGYLAMTSFTHTRLAGVKAKFSGWMGSRRRMAICSSKVPEQPGYGHSHSRGGEVDFSLPEDTRHDRSGSGGRMMHDGVLPRIHNEEESNAGYGKRF